MKNNKFIAFIITIIICLILLSIYSIIRDNYIYKENNKINEYTINQYGDEIK